MMLELRDVRTEAWCSFVGIAIICLAPFWRRMGELFIFGFVVRLVSMVVKLQCAVIVLVEEGCEIPPRKTTKTRPAARTP